MARTDIPVLDAAKNLAAGLDLTATWISADGTNSHKVLNRSSRVIIIVETDGSSSVDVTFNSVADPYGRTGGATEEGPTSIGNSKVMVFGPFSPALFAQKNGTYVNYLEIDVANVVGTPKIVAVSIP